MPVSQQSKPIDPTSDQPVNPFGQPPLSANNPFNQTFTGHQRPTMPAPTNVTPSSSAETVFATSVANQPPTVNSGQNAFKSSLSSEQKKMSQEHEQQHLGQESKNFRIFYLR